MDRSDRPCRSRSQESELPSDAAGASFCRRWLRGSRAERYGIANMTLDQAIAFAILLGTIALLIWDRIRYDLVALLALLASIACGIVKGTDAFRGFSDDIFIIVGSALVVSAAIGRSGLVETLMSPLVPRMSTSAMQVAVLASAVTAF